MVVAATDQGMRLYNPNHDPHSGEFSSGGMGGAGEGGGGASKGRSAGGGRGSRTGGAAKPKTEGAKPRASRAAKGAAEPEEDMHARSARLQREGHLPAEARPGEQLTPLPGATERSLRGPDRFDPYSTPGEHTKAGLSVYGEHQLGAVLHAFSTPHVTAAARELGVKPSNSKAATISRIVSHLTGGRYSANFGHSSRDPFAAHAAKAAKLTASRNRAKAALDKAQAALDAHIARAPKQASERGWHAREAARLLAEVKCARAVYQAAEAAVRGGGLMRTPGYGGPIQLGEVGSDGFHRSWIMLFPEGRYEHPQYGKLDFSRAKLAEIARQFDARVRHIDIALDANHDQDKATGWLERLELREDRGSQGQPGGLWGLVRWTPYGAQLLKDQLYRYFSPEFGPWEDPKTGKKYDDVLIGGGLTNRPFLKEMPAVTLADGTAVSRKPWGSVNKSMLPRSSFLDPGDPDKKSTWRLPVFEGAGPKDADGCYTKRGPLNINAVRAALAALGGAHTGTPMSGVPAGVKAKLEGWLKRYGGESQGESQQAREPADGGVEARRDMALEFDEDTQSFADSGEDDDEGMAYDDAAGDGDGADDEGGVDAESDTHGAFDGRHSHGKFGMHSHSDDGDHSDAPLAKRMSGGAAKKASEPRTVKQMREALASQDKQLAEMRDQLYRRDVAETLASWDAGKFQFSEAPRVSKGGASLPMVALSKRFTDRYSAFMLGEGARFSAGERKALNELIETALSAAVVDLSQRGASFDQERRKTISGGRLGERERALEGGEIVELAERRAQETGKRLSDLSYSERLALLVEAEREAR